MKLYTNCLESLIFLFIALDHQNYSSWLSVHIRDLNTMTDKQFKELSANSTIKKKKKKISNLPITKYTSKKIAK